MAGHPNFTEDRDPLECCVKVLAQKRIHQGDTIRINLSIPEAICAALRETVQEGRTRRGNRICQIKVRLFNYSTMRFQEWKYTTCELYVHASQLDGQTAHKHCSNPEKDKRPKLPERRTPAAKPKKYVLGADISKALFTPFKNRHLRRKQGRGGVVTWNTTIDVVSAIKRYHKPGDDERLFPQPLNGMISVELVEILSTNAYFRLKSRPKKMSAKKIHTCTFVDCPCKKIPGAKPKELMRCARCKDAFYCSVDCQRGDWLAGHRHQCVERVQLQKLKTRKDVSELGGGGITVGDTLIPLTDPNTMQRLKLPARGVNCAHNTCFELSIYLEQSCRYGKWICPNCKKPTPWDDLCVDQEMLMILNDPRIANCTKVIQRADGGYEPYTLEMEREADRRKYGGRRAKTQTKKQAEAETGVHLIRLRRLRGKRGLPKHNKRERANKTRNREASEWVSKN